MAYDAVVDRDYLNQGLTAIANSVRTKGGTSSPLAFPNGIKQAIDNIETGIMPTGTVNITANGTYDVTDKATAVVNVGASVDYLAEYISGTLTSYSNNDVEKIESYAFYHYRKLTSINLPNAKTIGVYAFSFSGITEYKNTSQSGVSLSAQAFSNNSNLQKIDLLNALSIGAQQFIRDTSLTTVIIRNTTTVPKLDYAASSAFYQTPIANGTGYIYVPSAMVDAYKTATNWSTFADQIRAIEDYPEITGG